MPIAFLFIVIQTEWRAVDKKIILNRSYHAYNVLYLPITFVFFFFAYD